MAGVKGQRSGGRNAKTTEQHRLDGTLRADRHGEQPTIAVPVGRPTAPRPLEGEARAEWDRMVARLEQAKTLSTVDDAALYQYAQLFGEVEALVSERERTAGLIDRLDAEIDNLPAHERGSLVGQLIKLKQIETRFPTQIRQGRMALRQFLVEFGMTPAARGRVKAHKEDDGTIASPLAQLQARATIHRVK